MRWARPAWLRMMRSDRAVSGSVGAGQQQLRSANDHREGIVELVAGPPGELAQGVEFSLAKLDFLGFDPIAKRSDDGLNPALEQAAIGDHRRPRFPGALGNSLLEPLLQVGWSMVAPELNERTSASPRFQREHEGWRARIRGS